MMHCEIVIGDQMFKGKWHSPSHFILQYLLIRIFHSNTPLPDRTEMPLKHLYKVIGNAVPPAFGRALVKPVLEFEGLLKNKY